MGWMVSMLLLPLQILENRSYRNQVWRQVQELQLSGRLGDLGHNRGRRSYFKRVQGAALVEMPPCPAGMAQGIDVGLVWPMSRFSLPSKMDKDHSNLWNPGAVELGLSPAFSITICTQPPGLQEWEQARSASPHLRCLS